jgi:hypothetical protein
MRRTAGAVQWMRLIMILGLRTCSIQYNERDNLLFNPEELGRWR